MKIDLANFEVSARLDLLHSIVQRLGAAAWLFTTDVESFTHVSVESFCGNVNGTIEGIEQNAQSACVVAVFVRDEHAVETLRVFTDEREPACNFFCAESCVDEHTRTACNDQHRVAS